MTPIVSATFWGFVSGGALVLGAAIGLSILHGGAVSIATVAAIFLSNLPEGISSSAGMRKAGRSLRMYLVSG